jgi:hypothetical protein
MNAFIRRDPTELPFFLFLPCEDKARRWTSANQKERKEKPATQTP